MLEAKSKHHSLDLATRYRYCAQDMFNILICGGFSRFDGYSRSVHEVDGRNLGNFTTTALQMIKNRAGHIAVYLRGEIFVF